MSRRAKLILISSTISVLLLSMLMAMVAGADLTGSADDSVKDTKISSSAAEKIAIEAAGVESKDATVIRRKLFQFDGKDVFDIEFYTVEGDDSINYLFYVDSDSGEILKSSKKVKKSSEVAYTSGEEKTEDKDKEESVSEYIGVERARRYAIKDSGLDDDEVEISDVELKHKDGKAYYAVLFESEGISYEFSVDAVKGTITKREVEYLDEDD